jgi:foldase protein PrsA
MKMSAARLMVGLLGMVVLAACGNLFDSAAAVVNGEKITTNKLEAELDRFRETIRYEQLAARAPIGEIERDYAQTYLTLLIEEAVLEGEAEERDIEVTPDEVNARIAEIKERIGSEGQFQEMMKEEGVNLEQVEFRVRVQILAEKLREKVVADVGPTEDELTAYYEDHIDEYQEVRVQHIVVSDESEAESIAKRLRDAKDDEVDDLFAKLAKTESEDPTAANGGDLGLTAPAEFGQPPFREAVSSLEVGEISDPVQTKLGYHVIRVLARQVTPFEEVRSTIDETIGTDDREEAFNEWLTKAYIEAEVDVNPAYGELNLDSHSVTNARAEDVPAGVSPRPSVSPEQ